MEHNFERLKAHILPLSNANDFDVARKEWLLIGVEVSEEWDNCPCGQDIKEHCYIENSLNGKTTYVGNVCINRFIGIDTGFSQFKNIVKKVHNTQSGNVCLQLLEIFRKFP